jgi:thermitase
MSRTIFLSILLLTLILFLTPSPLLAQGPVSNPNEPEFVPGEILVKFKPTVQRQDVRRQRLAQVQGNVARTIPALDLLTVKVPLGSEQEAIARLNSLGEVAYAEPNYVVYALDVPNDPYYVSQWSLPKIYLPAAWNISQGNGTIIAILDTGIDLDHPDFNCTVSGGLSKLTTGYNVLAPLNPPDDDNYHGTHVAGIAGACTNNGLGVAGVAPQARLMPVKVLNNLGKGTYDGVAAGIIYAVDHGAKILNLSLGASTTSTTLANAVNYAYSKGALLIAASGNIGAPSIYYPAAYENVVAVGSTNPGDDLSTFSNYGAGLDLVAPGSSIYSTFIGDYGSLDGTSMATPHVAGLAGLIWSVAPNSTHNQVRQMMQNTAQDLGTPGWDQYFGYGRINALQALEPYSVNLQETNGANLTQPVNFFIDDANNLIPTEKTMQVITANPGTILWSATISPAVSWLDIVPPDSGTISASSSNQLTLVASKPGGAYGTYSTKLTITGTTQGGTNIGSKTVDVKIEYIPKISRYWMPSIFKP